MSPVQSFQPWFIQASNQYVSSGLLRHRALGNPTDTLSIFAADTTAEMNRDGIGLASMFPYASDVMRYPTVSKNSSFLILAVPHKSLTSCSGLPHVLKCIISLVMSLNIFLTLSVLACDFLIYAFFQWTFGEKYRRRPRKAFLRKNREKSAIEITATRPYMVASRSPQHHARQAEREVA
jgi:hypothetical protein